MGVNVRTNSLTFGHFGHVDQLGAYSTPEGLRSTTLGFKSSPIRISKTLELLESANMIFQSQNPSFSEIEI